MAETNLKNIIRTSKAKYDRLIAGETVDGHTYDASNLYLIARSHTDGDFVTLSGNLTISGIKTFSDSLRFNSGFNVLGTTDFNGDVYIGGSGRSPWDYGTNSRSLRVSGTLEVGGLINAHDASLECGAITCNEINACGTVDLNDHTLQGVQVLSGSGFYFNGADNSASGNLLIGNNLNVDNQLNVLGGTYLQGSLSATDATFTGTVRTKNNLETQHVKPLADNTYNLGNTSKYYKGLYVNGIYSGVSGASSSSKYFATNGTILNIPTSLPADGGNADTVDTYHASYLKRGSWNGRIIHNVVNISASTTPKEFIVKTKIPFLSGSYMPSIWLKGYAYGDSKPVDVHFVFYIYNSTFCSYGAVSYGAWKPSEIDLFTYTDNGTKYIGFGFKCGTNGIYYPKMWIDFGDVMMSTMNYYDGWTVEFNTSSTSIIPASDLKTISYQSLNTSISGSAGSVSWTNVSGKPTNVSEFTNDSGYITASDSKFGNYLPLTGTGSPANNSTDPTNVLTGTLWFKNVDGIKINSNNTDRKIWEVVGNSGSYASQFGFDLQYIGTGSGNNNDLVLYSHNQDGTHLEVYRVKQDGAFAFKTTPKVGTINVSLEGHTHAYLPFSMAMNGTATSLNDIHDGSKLDVTSWSYSDSNKFTGLPDNFDTNTSAATVYTLPGAYPLLIFTFYNDPSKTYIRKYYGSTGYSNWVKVWTSGNLSPMTTSHAANGITATNISNWNAVHTWYTTATANDTTNTIDTWKEIEAFVSSFSKGDNLATFLTNNYLAKATAKNYVVTLGDVQTITGNKTFSGATTADSLTAGNLTVNGIAVFNNGLTGNLTGNASTASSVAWSGVTGKPTTLIGYGITDAKIENGVITLGSNTITPLTSSNSSVSLSGSTLSVKINGTTLSLTNTDSNVTQTVTNSGNTDYRPVILGASSNGSTNSFSTTTSSVYAAANVYIKPDNGNLYTKGALNASTTISSGTSISAGTTVTAATSVTSTAGDFYVGGTSGSRCHLKMDTTNKCLKFVFD